MSGILKSMLSPLPLFSNTTNRSSNSSSVKRRRPAPSAHEGQAGGDLIESNINTEAHNKTPEHNKPYIMMDSPKSSNIHHPAVPADVQIHGKTGRTKVPKLEQEESQPRTSASSVSTCESPHSPVSLSSSESRTSPEQSPIFMIDVAPPIQSPTCSSSSSSSRRVIDYKPSSSSPVLSRANDFMVPEEHKELAHMVCFQFSLQWY